MVWQVLHVFVEWFASVFAACVRGGWLATHVNGGLLLGVALRERTFCLGFVLVVGSHHWCLCVVWHF